MRQFYLAYHEDPFLQQLVGEIPWSRNVLVHQIESQAYERHSLTDKQHNLNETLPEHLAEQADKAMKEVYALDMLGIGEQALEAELENQMVAKIKDVLLELGYDFAFIGNHYHIQVHLL